MRSVLYRLGNWLHYHRFDNLSVPLGRVFNALYPEHWA